MSFDINSFRGNLKQGGARPTLFEVELSGLPAGIVIPDGGRFLIKASTLPETTIGQIEVPYFGRKIKIPGDRSYAEWSITVINDEDFAVRNALENWVNLLQDATTNTRTNLSQLGCTGEIKQYNKTGTGFEGGVIKSYKFFNMFPSSISTIDMSWETPDTIEEFTVTWQYDYFIPSTPQAL